MKVNKAPWLSWTGQEIFEHDIIIHPSGEEGRVVFQPSANNESDQWWIYYKRGASRLCLQIGPKGMGVVKRKSF